MTYLLAVSGLCYGLLSAAGVFTVFVAVGLVPRFAGKTHTAKHILIYEEMVIYGTIAGALLSLYPACEQLSAMVQGRLPDLMPVWSGLGIGIQIIYGLSSGAFVGCLALAIAEMLDSIPIFTRRVSFQYGVGIAILSIAFGKLAGALFYFWTELHQVVS